MEIILNNFGCWTVCLNHGATDHLDGAFCKVTCHKNKDKNNTYHVLKIIMADV